MKCQILLCVCLLIVLDAVVSAESKRAAELGTGKLHKERQLLKKGSLSKPKLHYTTTAAHVETKYGVDLPSFAFDYSEYFSGAVIERSHDNDLYLSVFMVGHKSISTDFPFHAISTDEEVLHSWSKAVNLWDKNSHKRAPAPNSRRLSAVTTEVSPRSPRSSHTAHSTSHHSSGLVCVLQNNDITPSQVYQASAYWVQAEHDADSTSTKNIFAVLRCKLKNTAVIYETISNHTTTALFVDIMRMNTNNRKTNARANSRNSTSTNTSTSASDSTVASDSRGSVLSSFSVPWSTRVVGYPLQHHSNASTLNPWARKTDTVTATPTTTSAAPITTTSTTTTHIAHATTTTSTSTLLCVPNVRPLHPRRPTALPQLIEYIEHYIQLGYDHIMLGVALDWKSKHMHKYLHVLSSYIRSGQISIYSTTLPGFDDVSGFGGIQLHDTYAEQYFVNMCLYYAKGMYSYVSVGRVEEVIVPGVVYSGSGSGSSGTFVQNVVSKLLSGGGGTSNKVPTTTRGTSRVHTNSMIQHAPCVYALTTTNPTTTHTTSSTTTTSTTNTTPKTNLRGARPATTTRTTNSTTSTSSSIHRNMLGKVTGRLDVYTVQDMSGAGPGEDVWSRDYYTSTVPQLLTTSATTNMYSVLFLPTDRVVRVEMAPSGVVTGHCKSVQSQYRRRHSSNSGSGSGAGNSTSVRATLYTTTATVNTPDVALFVYRNTLSSTTLNTTNSATTTSSATDSASTILRKYTHARAVMHNTTTATLSQRSISLASIKTLSQEALILFSDAHKSAQSAQPFNPFSDAPIPNKDQLSGDLPTRAAIKAPFWQLCNTDYLKDVIRKVFHV